ncbi:MAG TPA: hypothetical protein VJX92_15515 [Methylomirabilota bacterium]|nr:hypothetical protein [Methylomirabilota bacterium]
MKSRITALRSNPIPQGGTAATQPVPPNQTPASVAELIDYLTPAISRFRSLSSPLKVPLDTIAFSALGDQKQVRIASVGLGERIVAVHNVVINLANSGGGAQTVTVSPHFPYNLVANSAVQINGGETTYSASGRAGLVVWGRDRPGFWDPAVTGGFGLSPALVQTTAGANLTPTNQTNPFATWSGINTISIAAGTNGNLTVQFITVEKLAHSRDTLLGALPLQNNSTFATLTRQIVGALVTTNATNAQSPFFNAGANVTGTLTSYSVQQLYHFWGIPSDPSVYQPLIENSYQVIEQKSLTASATGTAAISYNVPQNLYGAAFHIFANDNNGANLNPNGGLTTTTPADFTRLALQYNAGSVVPVVEFPERQRALQFADYGADIGVVPGYRFWDGHNTTENLNISDDAGWLDTYSAAEPQLVIDLRTGVVTPVTFAVTREAVVAGAVQQLGG